MAAKPERRFKVVADNRKPRFNYEIGETYEAGIALTGSEVKSLRAGKATIAESFADSRGGEEINQTLSQERAEMVALELEKAGIPRERMIVEAMGERFASNEALPDDQAFERCVEIRLESTTSLASN